MTRVKHMGKMWNVVASYTDRPHASAKLKAYKKIMKDTPLKFAMQKYVNGWRVLQRSD